MSSGSKGKFILKEFVFKSSKPQNDLIKPPDKHDSFDVDDSMPVIKKFPSTKEQSITPEPIIPKPEAKPIIPEAIIPKPIMPEPFIPETIIPEPIISDPKEIVCLDNYNTVLKMAIKEEDNFMISTTLMRMIGYLQLINSQTRKLFGINVMKLVIISEMIIGFGVLCLIITNICYFSNKSNDLINVQPYIQYLVCSFLSTYKLYRIIKYSNSIWQCIKLTTTNNFLYKFHDCKILEIGKMRSKSFVILMISLWAASALIWMSEPLLMKHLVIILKRGDTIYHFRRNVFNFVFPGTDKFYNENFSFYYIFEVFILFLWTHSLIFYDFLLISLCIVMTFQIKTIGNSFSNFDITHKDIIDNNKLTLKQKEAILINDLKILIHDHQYVMRNTKSILRIFNTDMFVQIFVPSIITILSWSLTVMNYYDGVELLNSLHFKTVFTPLIFIYYFYINCYLFDKLSEEKEALHFAMYSGGWEKRNVPFRKLIMINMSIDRCNHMNIRLTEKKTINLVLFASVMHMTYSILSVLIKTIEKNEE